MSTEVQATAPWITTQTRQLLAQRGHAWLLQGPSGLGQYGLALSLARAWLCDNPSAGGACGACGSCHAIDVRTHADLCVLMPETVMLELDWPLGEKAQADIDDKKRKASEEIRVEAMREAVEFAQRTSARGHGKVVLVFPAEDMNTITANALLKTLEEPAGDVRFVLATESAHQLLPTIRSRCITHTMLWPTAEDASAWLQAQGVAPDVIPDLLRLCGGRPEDAWQRVQSGASAEDWARFPKALASGDVLALKEWSPQMLIEGAQKLCHDLMVQDAGAEPRFFAKSALKEIHPARMALAQWSKSLAQAMKTMEHPFNAGLMAESLVSQAQSVLHSGHSRTP